MGTPPFRPRHGKHSTKHFNSDQNEKSIKKLNLIKTHRVIIWNHFFVFYFQAFRIPSSERESQFNF